MGNIDSKILTFYRGQEDIVVNEKENYSESLFKDQYTHALLQIHQLVSKRKDNVPSILAFCGDRGEGKTSCMETVKTMLATLNNEQPQNTDSPIEKFMKESVINHETAETLQDRCESFNKIRFKVLDTIDPAFFDKDHNVVELVLGMMYHEIMKGDIIEDDSKRRELLEKFHDAKLCLTQQKKDKIELYDPIDELNWLSGGLALKETFQDLCTAFLKCSLKTENDNEHNYLVIAIDDIDLNISGAYEMAEQIRKYLCAENCIVLISLNIEQFIEVVSNSIGSQFKTNDYLGAIEMAQKYATKLIPMEYRIMMPKPYDFCDRPFRYVLNDKKEEKDGNDGKDGDDEKDGKEEKNGKDRKDEKNYASVKESIVKLIYDKTRFLFYNNKGSVSPIVPNNLRSLRHLLGMLISMPDFYSNEKSRNNKDDFKSYFYQVWTRQLTKEDRKKIMTLVEVVDTTNINKTVVSMLSSYIDNAEEDHMAQGILESDNYNYNVSVGDVFYLLDKIERSNVDRERALVLFFIRSFYSIKLYENYDIITENAGALYPNDSAEEEIYKSGQWLKRTNALQRLVNGAYFTFNPSDLIPMNTSPKMYRDTKVYSGMEKDLQEIMKTMAVNIRRFNELPADIQSRFIKKFRVVEFFVLTTKRGIRQRDTRNFSLAKRNVSMPYCLTNYQNTNYFVFDVMAPFSNIVNIEYSYNKFTPLIDSNGDEELFFNFAKEQKGSLLNEMIREVAKKEYADDYQDEMPQERIENICANDYMIHRLMSNATIRNAEVLLSIMETMKSNRIRMHFGSGDNLEVIAKFYQSIIDSEMRTYYSTSTNKRYTIRFAFLNALIKELRGDEKETIRYILESGPALAFNEFKDIENRFANFFNGFKSSKKASLIKSEMINLYPTETQNMTDEDWLEMFPNKDKSVSKTDILKAFSSKGVKLGLSD